MESNLSLIEKLPADILKLIIILLDLKNIINLLKCSKGFYKYRLDNKLWRLKYEDELGELDDEDNPYNLNYFYLYLQWKAEDIDYDAIESLREYKVDNKYIKLKFLRNYRYGKNNTLISLGERYSKSHKKNELKLENIRKTLNIMQRKCIENSSRLYNIVLKYFHHIRLNNPLKYEVKYIEIKLDEDILEKFTKVFKLRTCDHDYSYENYLINCNYMFKECEFNKDYPIGNLIRLRDKEGKYKILLYPYEYKYVKMIEIKAFRSSDFPVLSSLNESEFLPHMIPHRLLISHPNEINKLYGNPFNIINYNEDHYSECYFDYINDFSGKSKWKVIPDIHERRYIDVHINKEQYNKFFLLFETIEDLDDDDQDLSLELIYEFLKEEIDYANIIYSGNLLGFGYTKNHPLILIHFGEIDSDEKISFERDIPGNRRMMDISFQIVPGYVNKVHEKHLPQGLINNYTIEEITEIYKVPFTII